MKSLIIGDCGRLIKLILFGDKEGGTSKNKIAYEHRHLPSNKIWPGKSVLRENDLYFDELVIDNRMIENEKFLPENNMELAIYHCKGIYLNY
jgi:hypothetical protein